MRHLRWLFVGLLILTPVHLQAQTPQAKRAITIDDYFTQADLFQVAYSKDNIAYTEGRWQEATDDRKTDLWVVPRSGSAKPRRLTAEHRCLERRRAGEDEVETDLTRNGVAEGTLVAGGFVKDQ